MRYQQMCGSKETRTGKYTATAGKQISTSARANEHPIITLTESIGQRTGVCVQTRVRVRQNCCVWCPQDAQKSASPPKSEKVRVTVSEVRR